MAKRKAKAGPPPVEGCEECLESVQALYRMGLGINCDKHGHTVIKVKSLFDNAIALENSISDAKAHQMGRYAVATWVLKEIAGPGAFDIKRVADELIRVMREAQTIINRPEVSEEGGQADDTAAA